MGTYDINNLSFAEILKSELIRKKGSLLLSLFLCFTCIFTGIFFSLCLSSSDMEQLWKPVSNLLSADSTAILPPLLMNMFLLALIYLSGLSLYGFPASLFILSGKSLSIGFCIGLFYNSEVRMMLPLIFSNIFLMTALVLASFLSINYAIHNIAYRSAGRQFRKEYTLLFALPAILTVIYALVDKILLRIF